MRFKTASIQFQIIKLIIRRKGTWKNGTALSVVTSTKAPRQPILSAPYANTRRATLSRTKKIIDGAGTAPLPDATDGMTGVPEPPDWLRGRSGDPLLQVRRGPPKSGR